MQTERSISEEAWGEKQDRSYATYLIHSEIILLTFSPLVIPSRCITLSTMYMMITSESLSLPIASLSLLDCRVHIQHLHLDTQ